MLGAFKEQLMVNPYLTIIYCGDDEVVIKHSSRSRFTQIIRDSERSKLLGKILRNVVSPTSLEALQEHCLFKKEELEDLITLVDYLKQEGVLINPEKNLMQVYLDTILKGKTPFSSLTVGMIGVGYLGSRIATELARLGIGKLVFLDNRQVEKETVDSLYFNLIPNSIINGRYYTQCTQEDLKARGFTEVEIITAEVNDATALKKCAMEVDFLVASLEVFSSNTLHTINAVAIETEKPWISIYTDGSEAVIGPIYVPGQTCCYNEFEIQQEATLREMKDSYLLYKEALNEGKMDYSHFVIPPYLSMASGLASTGIMHFLLSGRSFLVERCHRIDFERLSVDYGQVLRLPRCPACSSQRPAYRHLFM